MSVADTIQHSELTYNGTFGNLRVRSAMCDLYFRQQFSKNYYVEELALIRDQNELIQKIKQNMASKGMASSICKQDRQNTRDPDISQLSQVRSTGALLSVGSPANSLGSVKSSYFRRSPSVQTSNVSELICEVQRNCSDNARQLLEGLIKKGKSDERQNRRLKACLLRSSQEIEAIKLRQIATETKLYDLNKKLQAHEAQNTQLRNKREDYVTKLIDLEHRQIELNKFQICCMVRQKALKAQTKSLSDWTHSIQKYRSEILTLKCSIEQVINNPQAFTFKKLADTVIRSLQNQQSELDSQGLIVSKLEQKLEAVLSSLRQCA